jgi:TonB-dependent starch-binding outer membrane protein SusC
MKGVFARVFALALLMGVSAEAFAQAATISGRVTNTEGQPIVGANVLIPSLNAGTTSGANGVYQFSVPESQANGQRVTLTARFIGFTPVSRQITLTTGVQTQNFELKTDPFRLEEMVVTGVADATSTKKLAFSVSRISEEPALASRSARATPALPRRSVCVARPTSRSATTIRSSSSMA